MATTQTSIDRILSDLGITARLTGTGTDRSLDAPVPRETARALVARLTEAHIAASEAPDHDDRCLSWVYIAEGTTTTAAKVLGRKGGSQRTPAQTAARQTNGRKGGRPRTTIEVVGNPFDAEDAGIPCPCCLDGHIRYLVLRGTGQWRCDECGRRWSYQRDARTINAPLVRGTMVRAR